jgi:glycosyltransferase involved in cell wall biosynthesis
MPARLSNEVTSLYICHWSLQDPLCQSQGLGYLRKLSRFGHKFVLMTYEQPKYKLDSAAAAAMKSNLASQGIYWYPISYHKGASFRGKAIDFLSALGVGIYASVRHRPRVMHSRGSTNATIALVLSRLCGVKFLYDADSVLSEEYVDIGHWSRRSLAFRVTAGGEQLARKYADSIIVLSDQLRRDFASEIRDAVPIEVIPCCVDTEKFRFDPEARASRRQELGVTNEKVFVYVGKIGSWYLVDEMFEFFKIARAHIGAGRLLILTGDYPDAFHEAAKLQGIREQDYCVRCADHNEVVEWLSAADVGLSFIRSVNSKRGSSPVKVSEYLAVGLPVVITSHIGDCSALIAQKHLGVVISEFTMEAYLEGAERLQRLWREGSVLRNRCRIVAETNFSLDSIGAVRYQGVYQELLKPYLLPLDQERQ